MIFKKTKIRVPLGITNIGPGSGVLGVALSIYNIVEFIETNTAKVEFEIRSLSKDIPKDETNLLFRAANEIFKRENYSFKGLKIICDQGIPVNRGLGSSSSAIIAGITCARMITNSDISEKEILEIAYELDEESLSCIPTYFGGLTISSLSDFTHVPIPVSNVDMKMILIIPGYKYSKEHFLEMIPKEFSYSSVQNNIAKTAQFVTGLCYNETDLIESSLKNEMICFNSLKYLILGFEDIRLTTKINGGYGISICGQGPSIVVMCPAKSADIIAKRIVEIFDNFKEKIDYHICDIDNTGITVIE